MQAVRFFNIGSRTECLTCGSSIPAVQKAIALRLGSSASSCTQLFRRAAQGSFSVWAERGCRLLDRMALGRILAAETLRRHIRTLLLRQQRRCGVALADCCCGSRDVAASHSETCVLAAETLRRHTRKPLLRQQRRSSVAFADRCCSSRNVAASHSETSVLAAETLRRPFAHCWCGSRDVAASHSQTAVAAAETLQRHFRRPLLRQHRRYGVTLDDCCCGSRDVVESEVSTLSEEEPGQRPR